MLKRFLLVLLICSLKLNGFTQTIVIRQNNTDGHQEFGTIAFLLNSALLNNDYENNARVNLSKCRQSKDQLRALSTKFRKLYPGVSYGTPNVMIPVSKTSDTITYEQTYVKISQKKKKLSYYLQLKITFAGKDPEGEFYYPYITNIEVKGPKELSRFDTSIIAVLKSQKE